MLADLGVAAWATDFLEHLKLHSEGVAVLRDRVARPDASPSPSDLGALSGAMSEIAKERSRENAAALLGFLKHPCRAVRINAVIRAAEQPSPEVIRALVGHLSDTSIADDVFRALTGASQIRVCDWAACQLARALDLARDLWVDFDAESARLAKEPPGTPGIPARTPLGATRDLLEFPYDRNRPRANPPEGDLRHPSRCAQPALLWPSAPVPRPDLAGNDARFRPPPPHRPPARSQPDASGRAEPLPLRRSDLERHLRRHGCAFVRHGGGHDIWKSASGLKQAAVPRHRDVAMGTCRAICKQLEIPAP